MMSRYCNTAPTAAAPNIRHAMSVKSNLKNRNVATPRSKSAFAAQNSLRGADSLGTERPNVTRDFRHHGITLDLAWNFAFTFRRRSRQHDFETRGLSIGQDAHVNANHKRQSK